MRFISILFIMLFIAIIPVTYSANIIGWGSNAYQPSNSHNALFDIGFISNSTEFNQQINFGSSTVQPISCNLNPNYMGNELIITSGAEVRIYTGQGNTLTLLEQFNQPSTVLDMGCTQDTLYLGDANGLSRLHYEDNILINTRTVWSAGYSINCGKDENVCIINTGFELLIFNGTDRTQGFIIEYDDFTISETSKVFIGNNDLTKFWVILADTNVKILSKEEQITGSKFKGSLSANLGGGGRINGYNLVKRDGVNYDICTIAVSGGTSGTHTAYCRDLTGTETQLLNAGFSPVGTITNSAQKITSFENNVCFFIWTLHTSNNHYTNTCYDNNNNLIYAQYSNAYNNLIDGSPKFIKPYSDNDNYFILYGNKLYSWTSNSITLNQTLSSFNISQPFVIMSDITGDNNINLISSGSGFTNILYNQDINTNLVPTSITFAGNTVNGGFFGYYQGDICTNTTVTFKAQECVGDITVCNYYNTNIERERLRVDCGNGIINTGNYANTNPSVTCHYNTTGNYEVILYIQAESNPDSLLVNNANTPINLKVEDSPSCNGLIYEQPRLIGDPIDSGQTQPPTEPISPPPTPTTPEGVFDGSIFKVLQDNIKLVVGMILILGAVGTMASNGIRNPIILLLGAVVGLILAVALGLIGTGALVLMIVVIISLFLLSMTLFKTQVGD